MRYLGLIFIIMAHPLHAAVVVADNHNTPLSLSQSNYNRLVVKNDKIVEAVFPENAMSIRPDEADGSVYVMASDTEPFTLFLATESGHHFSMTVSPEASLGKTIEIVLSGTHPLSKKPEPLEKEQQKPSNYEASLIQSMEHHALLPGVEVSHPFNHVEHMGLGLTLFLKEVWKLDGVQIERLEVLNRGKDSIQLLPEWFSQKNQHASKLLQSTLKPHETTLLYRVREVGHG